MYRTSKCILVTSGGVNDIAALHKVLQHQIASYQEKTGTEISTEAIAQLISTRLYYRRFFPYYAFNVLGGLDKEGMPRCDVYVIFRSWMCISV